MSEQSPAEQPAASGPDTIDTIIAKAMGMPEPEPEPEDTIEEPAEPTEAQESEPEEVDTEPEESQAQEDESPAPAAKQGSDALRKAREAAKLAGFPESEVKSMSDAALLAFAKSKAKNDADRQRTFQENADLKRQLADLQKAPEVEEPQQGLAETEDALDPELVDEFGEQVARAISSMVAKKVAPLEAQVKAAEAKAQEQQVRAVFDAMQEAGEFGPGVPEYEQVLEKAVALSQAGGLYAGLTGEERARAVFRDSAKLLADLSPSSPEPEEAKPAPAKTATVTRVPQRTVRATPQNGSPDAAVDRMIAAAVRGDRDPNAIARKYG